jgi:uncharacterized protein (DUF1501 family)
VTAVTNKSMKSASESYLRCAAHEGCTESRLLLSRRAMLGVTAGLFSWAYMPRFATAASADPRLLVVVLRGGTDGINMVVPHGDQHYVSMRGPIAIPKTSTIPLNSFFGLHPAMPKFGAMFQANEAAVVHATCVPMRNRSHFDAQDNLEAGLPGKISPSSTGWLNRLLTALPASAPVRMHGAIEINEAPLILRGPAPVLGWSSTWFEAYDDPGLQRVRSLYEARDQQMYDMLERGLEANRLAGGADNSNISMLRKGFRGAGRLIGAVDGPRIAVLSVDGWDTHSDQGGTTGYMADVMADLDTAIEDFKIAVGSAWGDTVMVAATEFGRTVRTNGDEGTDHGVGTVALLAGGAVNGGKVFGDWPGLAPNQLYEDSDLWPTTDLRSVFKGILKDHLGVPRSLLNGAIFPDSAGELPFKSLIKGGAGAAPAMASANAPLRVETGIARYRREQRS